MSKRRLDDDDVGVSKVPRLDSERIDPKKEDAIATAQAEMRDPRLADMSMIAAEATPPFSSYLPMLDPFTAPTFYVRECFPQYYEYMMDSFATGKFDKQGFTVSGAPGIGKSVFMAYVFLRFRLENSDATITMRCCGNSLQPRAVLVWKEGAICEFVRDDITAVERTYTKYVGSSSLVLVDGVPDCPARATRYMVFTSPNAWLKADSLAHSSSRQRLLFYKIKGLRLSGWDRLHTRRGCPHCPALGSRGGNTHHIVWSCPLAQRLWLHLRSWWSSLGLWPTSSRTNHQDFFTAVFSLLLPRTPPKVWDMASLSQRSPESADALDGPFPALQAAWQQLVLETLVVIVAWRNGRADAARAWSSTQAEVIHDGSCQRILSTLAHRFATDERFPASYEPLIRELQAIMAAPSPPLAHEPSSEPPAHVLFFDGGSRGNPGPGGSGACVVRVEAHTGLSTVVWSASTSHAHRATTNNQAEYQGLITGLRAAQRYR